MKSLLLSPIFFGMNKQTSGIPPASEETTTLFASFNDADKGKFVDEMQQH